jgi:hypothetical protein
MVAQVACDEPTKYWKYEIMGHSNHTVLSRFIRVFNRHVTLVTVVPSVVVVTQLTVQSDTNFTNT